MTPNTAGPDDTAELEVTIRRVLDDIAPDIGGATADPDADFHDDFGLDSMDTLNLAVALHEATGIDIPESDYPKITTITRCVAYLHTRRSPKSADLA